MASVAASVGGSLVSGLFGKKAAGQQAAGQQQAIDTIRGFNQPFVDFGTQGLNPLADFVNNGANFSDTQAFKDIINTQKAGGGSLSGNQLSELSRFNAVNFRPQRFNELFRVAQLGQQAAAGTANQIGGLQQGIGATRAGGTLGVGNALGSGIQALGGLNFSSLVRPSNLSNPSGFNQNTLFQTPGINTGFGRQGLNFQPNQPFRLPGRP